MRVTRTEMKVDFTVANEGTLFLFTPLTLSAYEWIEEHCDDDAQWFGNSLVVEHSYARGLAEGMVKDGLRLR